MSNEKFGRYLSERPFNYKQSKLIDDKTHYIRKNFKYKSLKRSVKLSRKTYTPKFLSRYQKSFDLKEIRKTAYTPGYVPHTCNQFRKKIFENIGNVILQ